jgi:H+-translocating NAD(P) transhydrogenase subunit alpha
MNKEPKNRRTEGASRGEVDGFRRKGAKARRRKEEGMARKESRSGQVIPQLSSLVFSAPLRLGALALTVVGAGALPAYAEEPAKVAEQSDWSAMLFVFMLATFIGLGVITRVSRLLHTPLMSLTNAISAIAIVGAIAVAGGEHALPITLLGAIALFASTTNIVSGFLITDRMLKMFKRQERTK